MLKKVGFPIACAVIGIIGCVFDCINSINDKDIDEKIEEAVNKKFDEIQTID